MTKPADAASAITAKGLISLLTRWLSGWASPRAGGASWLALMLLVLILLMVIAPILSLVVIAFGDAGDVWPHLLSTVLPRSVMTTLWLMLGVAGSQC